MRCLIDVICTIEVECDSLDDLEEVATDHVNAYFPDEMQSWRLDDSFTVVES